MSLLRQLLILIGLGGVLAGAYYGYGIWTEALSVASQGAAGSTQGPGPRARRAIAVEIAPVTERLIEERLEAVGTTLAGRAVEIVPLASGRVVDIGFETGELVDGGQVLIRLDDDIERANLAEAEAKAREARRALERSQTLRRNNTVSAAALEQLESALTIAESELARARRRLADREVRAPFAGVMGLRRVDLGARVDTDTVIASLDDLSRGKIECAVPEVFFAEVAVGDRIEAEAAAFPGRRFDGRVSAIDSRIDVVGRSFKVRAEIPNADRALPAGMFLRLSIVLDAAKRPTVPETAIVVDAGTSYVFEIADGKALKVPVEIVKRRPGHVAIGARPAVDALVAVKGLQRLSDGAAVRVVNAPPSEPDPVAAPTSAAPGPRNRS